MCLHEFVDGVTLNRGLSAWNWQTLAQDDLGTEFLNLDVSGG